MSKKPVQIQPLQTFLLNNKPYHYSVTESGDIVIKKGENKAYKPSKSKKEIFYPTLEEVKAYFLEKGHNEESAIKAFNHYSSADWHDSTGKPVIHWKQKMLTNWMNDKNKIVPASKESGFVM